MCVSSVGFAWGVLRGVLGEYALSGFHVLIFIVDQKKEAMLVKHFFINNVHKTGRAPVGPNVVCLCLHIKKGKDHFDTFNAHFIFAQFLIILHLSKKGRRRLI